MGSLTGKNIVVIGGTSGIGLATAIQANEEGAKVWAVGRSEERVKSAASQFPNINFSACDTHDLEGLAQLFKSVGTVDHIVGAATGANRTMKPFMEQTAEQFSEAFNKFWGYCNVVRVGVPHLTDTGSVTLVSGTPARKCNPGMSSVSCVGNAVEGLTRALATELAPRRVNVVAPGTTNTGMFDWMGDKKDENLANMSKGILLQRAGLPEEVASAILLTLTNNYMTGITIDVDGGQLLP
ncbi:MAG: SDR family oxidoreductase [Pseudomonadales bacterium]|jgi:NAD(P)-dependent dehydrogenase (short-subunit alcohol dehydrogenase family)|nr:SDR family oxidoreductase [Pseudomonadales bacterium]MDG1443640.1 SDR family oxidoreductase [Pseudomonadales bacterium]